MRRRKWLRRFLAIPAIAAAIIVWAALTHGRDDYPFLDGHGTTDVGVLGPGSWGAKEIRVYSWQQSWTEVSQKADGDLIRAGLDRRNPPKNTNDRRDWSTELIDGGPCGKGASTWVVVSKGRANPLRSNGNLTDGDPEWVTVMISADLDENWINVIRYTFFSLY